MTGMLVPNMPIAMYTHCDVVMFVSKSVSSRFVGTQSNAYQVDDDGATGKNERHNGQCAVHVAQRERAQGRENYMRSCQSVARYRAGRDDENKLTSYGEQDEDFHDPLRLVEFRAATVQGRPRRSAMRSTPVMQTATDLYTRSCISFTPSLRRYSTRRTWSDRLNM